MAKKILIALALLILFADSYAGKNIQDDITAKTDALMSEYDKMQIFSGVVLLAKDGIPVYEKSFGYADWTNKTPNNTSTLFNIASVTKAFTQFMIMQLEKEGKLTLSDPLSKYLSLYTEATGSKIKISNLLDMSAGLNDYLRDPAFNQNPASFTTIDDFLRIIKDEPLLFEPGTSKEYSNSGYVVLGGIIEKVTGISYEENLKERIFSPFGMQNSYYKQTGTNIENTAKPTRIKFDGTKMTMRVIEAPSPAGGIYTNAEDLLKFDKGLRENFPGMAGSVRAGGTPGWNSILGEYKDGYTLIILSNFAKMAEEVELRMSAIMQGKEYKPASLPFEMKLYSELKEKGSEEFKKNLRNLVEESGMEYNDIHLNMMGYGLMESGDIEGAINVFKINTELFPGVPNVWDSLAEAYMKKGENALAIQNYEKVIAMQPGNENAKQMLEKLKSN